MRASCGIGSGGDARTTTCCVEVRLPFGRSGAFAARNAPTPTRSEPGCGQLACGGAGIVNRHAPRRFPAADPVAPKLQDL